MADGDPVADDAGESRVGMDHRHVLDIGGSADPNRLRIAAEHRLVPDAGVDADLDVAQDDRAGGDEDGGIDPRLLRVGRVGHNHETYVNQAMRAAHRRETVPQERLSACLSLDYSSPHSPRS